MIIEKELTVEQVEKLSPYLDGSCPEYVDIESLNGLAKITFSETIEIDIDVCLVAAIRQDKYIKMYPAIKAHWQFLADRFALENIELGILTDGKVQEVADKFKPVLEYLNLNATTLAATSIDTMVRDDKYCTDARLNALKNSLMDFIATFE